MTSAPQASTEMSPNESFKHRAARALSDRNLKTAIDRTTQTAEARRTAAVDGFPQFAQAREIGAAIKDHVIANLGHYLRQFEERAEQSGAKVHFARTSAEAAAIVIDICRQADAAIVTRSKSMLGEEIGLPHALDQHGFSRVETDLAEHIVQLADERPSHIIFPAMHKRREDVADLFRQRHAIPPNGDSPPDLVKSARRDLREKFLNADVGISGANFLVAETGAVCTVTNEGNAELTTTPPRIHIVTAGIEKLVPTTEHAMALLRVLVRSATGGDFTQYTTFHCGPKRQGDADGPEAFHIVLVDNSRTAMRTGPLADMLRCIRCGACMNHCVVYRQIGGHAYGGTYPGPMGAVLTPVFDGLKKSRDLPHACTLNGRCAQVCPVNIPLPTLLRGWRDRSWRDGLEPVSARWPLRLWAFAARHPALYRTATNVALPIMRLFARNGRIASLPLAGGWTHTRDLPAPARRTFLATYKAGEAASGQRL